VYSGEVVPLDADDVNDLPEEWPRRLMTCVIGGKIWAYQPRDIYESESDDEDEDQSEKKMVELTLYSLDVPAFVVLSDRAPVCDNGILHRSLTCASNCFNYRRKWSKHHIPLVGIVRHGFKIKPGAQLQAIGTRIYFFSNDGSFYVDTATLEATSISVHGPVPCSDGAARTPVGEKLFAWAGVRQDELDSDVLLFDPSTLLCYGYDVK
jgi:hypothetical protein